ncbi:MAG: DUF2092 domain-containing protein [Candidatus Sumerlaeia bacterium]
MVGRLFRIALSAVLLMFIAAPARSQAAPRKPAIDPEADAVLRQMSDSLKGAQSAIFRVADTIDDVQADGRKIQYAHVRELTVQRPNKLKVETRGDVTNRTVWMDGKTLTVYDKDKNVYAEIPEPGTIDEAVDMLQDKYNLSLPASDLLCADVYKSLTEGCGAIEYVGLGYVGEEKCHHLAFTADTIDYQLWVGAGDKPGPRKIVITYKRLPGQPQYTMQLLKKEDPSGIKDSVFEREIPNGAEKIEIQPVAKTE